MRKIFILLALLLCCAGKAKAQAEIPHYASDPATCDNTRGLLYFNTTSNIVKACTALNTWTQVGGGITSVAVLPATCTAPSSVQLTAISGANQPGIYDCVNGFYVLRAGNFPVLINQSVDAFNRTGANLGANWTVYLNALSVTPGAVVGTAAAVNVSAFTGVSSTPTQTARVTVSAINGADTWGALVRIGGTPTTSVNYYACIESSTAFVMIKNTGIANAGGGVSTTLAGPATITGAAGDVITTSIVGNTISCYRNNASNPLLQVNDSSSPLTTGFPGISIQNATITASSFTLVNPVAPVGAITNIVFDGDSIIAANGNGSNGTDSATSFLYLPYANAYVANLGVSSKCLGVTCAAVSSGNIESMLTTGTSVIDTLFVPGIKNILVIFGGTNDISALGNRTPAQVNTDLTTYITARHAAGWKVISVPPLSRASTTSPAIDTKEGILASLVLANTAGADAVVTLPCSLICTGASQNVTLFNSDQIHPTEATHIDILARAFNAVLSKF